MKTKEQIKAEWEHIHWIKEICYGFGIPPASATEYYAARDRVQKEYNKLSPHA